MEKNQKLIHLFTQQDTSKVQKCSQDNNNQQQMDNLAQNNHLQKLMDDTNEKKCVYIFMLDFGKEKNQSENDFFQLQKIRHYLQVLLEYSEKKVQNLLSDKNKFKKHYLSTERKKYCYYKFELLISQKKLARLLDQQYIYEQDLVTFFSDNIKYEIPKLSILDKGRKLIINQPQNQSQYNQSVFNSPSNCSESPDNLSTEEETGSDYKKSFSFNDSKSSKHFQNKQINFSKFQKELEFESMKQEIEKLRIENQQIRKLYQEEKQKNEQINAFKNQFLYQQFIKQDQPINLLKPQ